MKATRHALALLLAVLLAVSCLAGCSGSDPSGQQSPDSSQSQSQTPDSSPSGEDTQNGSDPQSGERTVTDMAGRTVTIPAQVETVGVLGSIPVINGFIEALGAGDRICNNMSSGFTKNGTWKYQFEFAPQLADCPVFEEGGEILAEVVLETDPDVCFVMEQAKAEELEEIGVAAVCLAWREDEDVKTVMTLLGEILGTEEAAQRYCEYFDDAVARADALTATLADEDKKTVLAGTVSSLEYPLLIGEWWIRHAGGLSVTDNGRTDETYYVNYSVEDLLKWNPEVIITNRSSQVPLILEDTNFSGITAVQNGALYASPCVAHIWGNRTVEQPLMIFWTMNKLYPDLFTEEDLAQEIRSFYSEFFLYDMTDEQIQAIIHTPNE